MYHIVTAVIFLLVAIFAVVAVVRQLKYKNMFALIYAAITALVFGFFSIATLIDELSSL